MRINQFITKMVYVGYAFMFLMAQTSYASQTTHENELTEDPNYHALKSIAFASADQAIANLYEQKRTLSASHLIQNYFFVIGHDLYQSTPHGKITCCGELQFNELASKTTKDANMDRISDIERCMIYSIFYPSGRLQYDVDISSSLSHGKGANIIYYYDEQDEWGHPINTLSHIIMLSPANIT